MVSENNADQFLQIEGFQGEVLQHGGRGYAAARQIFNMRMDDVNPSVILKASSENDVSLVMKRAAELGHPIGLRSGGHNVDGTPMAADVVLDLSALRQTNVDLDKKRLSIGPGILLGDLDALCQEHSMVVPTGTVGTTGVTGLTLGGGIGFKTRELGATVDHVLRARVVTTSGEIVTASADENADLFWGLRGAGANFGVVTELEFQATPFTPLANVARLIFPLDQAVSVTSRVNAFMKDAPRELALYPFITRAPRGQPGPPTREPFLMILMVTTGDAGDFEKYVETVSSFGPTMMKETVQLPWNVANTMLEEGAPRSLRSHNRGGYVQDPGEDFFAKWVEHGPSMPDPDGLASFAIAGTYCNGAMTEDFEEDSMAFSRENANFLFEAVGIWTRREEDRANVGWIDGVVDAARPQMLTSAYINLTSDNNLEWLKGVYGKPEKFQRLVDLKTKWDPQNLLRYNRNIPPATA